MTWIYTVSSMTERSSRACVPLTPSKSPSLPGASSGLSSIIPRSTFSTAIKQNIKDRLNELLAHPDHNTITNETKTHSLCQYYATLIPEDKAVFLKVLSADYSVNQDSVLQLAAQLPACQSRGSPVLLRVEDRLRHALIPRYQHLFTQISHLDNGVKFLVDLRADLLILLSQNGADHDNPHLHAINSCLRDLFALWFSVGFLQLERITWQSPADVLQKISEYEAVHPIRNYTDLMHRVGPYRRCYMYTHASMPREPVVVLHTALTIDISSSIQSIVTRTKLGDERNKPSLSPDVTENPEHINSAIFYSITSTQRGLQGVEMGNYLIKRAVKELLLEFPNMSQFSSLSPIPGFKDWLMREINMIARLEEVGEHPEQTLFLPEEVMALEEALGSGPHDLYDSLRKVLQNNTWVSSPPVVSGLYAPLVRLCARYLYVEKRRGVALNPVANFHLRNGAVIWRINWLADTSPRGLGASCGLMVNYRYYLEQTEQNSVNYLERNVIVAHEEILKLVSHLSMPKSSHQESNSTGS